MKSGVNLEPTTVEDSTKQEIAEPETTKPAIYNAKELVRSIENSNEILDIPNTIDELGKLGGSFQKLIPILTPYGMTTYNTETPGNVAEAIAEPFRGIKKGIEKFGDNPVAGTLDITNSLLQLVATPFTVADQALRATPQGEVVADVASFPFEKVDEAIRLAPQVITEFVEEIGLGDYLRATNPDLVITDPLEKEKLQDIAESTLDVTATVGQFGVGGVMAKGAKLLKGEKATVKEAVTERNITERTTPQETQRSSQQAQRAESTAPIEGDVAAGGRSITHLKPRESALEQRSRQLAERFIDENATPELIDAGKAPKGELVTKRESTLINDKIKNLEEGARLGRRDLTAELQEVQGMVVEYARENLPKSEMTRGQITPLMNQVKNAKNINDVKKAYTRINEIFETVETKRLFNDVSNLLKRTKPSKDKLGKPTAKVSPEAQTIINEIKLLQNERGKQRANEILEGISEGRIDLTPDVVQQLHLIEIFGDLKNKNSQQLLNAKAELQSIIKNGRTELQKVLENRKNKTDLLVRATRRELQGAESTLNLKEFTQEQQKAFAESQTFIEKTRDFIRGTKNGEGLLSQFDTILQGWETQLDKLARRDRKTQPGKGFMADYYGRKVHESYVANEAGIRTKYEIINNKVSEIYQMEGRQLNNALSENARQKKTGIKIKQNGKETDLYLSQNEAGYIWQLAQNERVRADLKTQGYTDKVLRDIESWLDPRVKQLADWQMKEFYEKSYNEVNLVHRAEMGMDIPKIDKYTPIARESNVKGLEVDLQKGTNFYSSIYQNYFKERTGSKSPIKIQDMNKVMLEYMMGTEHYKSWAGTVRELRSVFGNQKVANDIKALHGSKQYNVINRFINDFARGGIDKLLTNKILDTLRGRVTKAKLGLNLPVFFKQLASLPAYLYDLKAVEFAKGLGDFAKNPIEAIKTLSQSEYMRARYGHGWDIDVIQSMRRDVSNKMAGVDNLTNKLMFPTKYGDRIPILAGGWAVYKTKYNQYRAKGMPDAVARKRAMTDFERATDRSQQSGTLQSLSEIQRSGSLARFFTMFMTSQNQYYRQMSSGIRNLRAGRGSKVENIKKIALTHFILPMTFQYISDGFRFDEKRQLRAAITGGTNGIFIASDIVEGIVASLQGEYYMNEGIQTPVADLFNKIQDAIENTTKEEWVKVLDDIAGATSDATGIPYDPVKRMAVGLIDEMSRGDDLWTGIRKTIGFSDYALDNKEEKPKKVKINSDFNFNFDFNLK